MLLKTGWQILFRYLLANRFLLMLALPLKLPADAFRLKPPTGPRGRSFDVYIILDRSNLSQKMTRLLSAI